jgi:hypothetical protein
MCAMQSNTFHMALTESERRKHEAAAKARGISLSSFYRLVANEYLNKSGEVDPQAVLDCSFEQEVVCLK